MFLRKLPNFVWRNSLTNMRWVSSTKREFKEVAIRVPWGHVAGKWWEPYESRPILAIHGWQDTCQSFDRLIPMLSKDVGFLSIDLPGHGYSSRLPDGMIYHYTILLLVIKSIAKSLNWPKLSIMGHSSGGILSYVYGMYFPADIDFLICIEGAKPTVQPNKHENIAKSFDEFFKYNDFLNHSHERPVYTIEKLKIMLAQAANNSISPEYTTYIMERNIAPSKHYPGKFYLTTDPRLKIGAMVRFRQEEIVKLAKNMKMPMIIIKAKGFNYYEPKENFYNVLDVLKKNSVDCEYHYVEGRHHVHLNHPERIAEFLNNFIEKYKNVEDRSTVGGCREEIIVEIVKKVNIK